VSDVDITYTVKGGELTENEAALLTAKAKGMKGCDHFEVKIDGDFLDVDYHIMPIERIRRITGYLVGTLDRFNDAKRAEVGDRVKHTTFEGDDNFDQGH
jgi:hypothetical protein